MPSDRLVIPAHAGIQVTDTVRHTVENRYPGGGLAWIPAFAGMTDPGGIFTAQIIAALVFSKEDTKSIVGAKDFSPLRYPNPSCASYYYP